MAFLFSHAFLSQIIANIPEIITNHKDDIIVQLFVLSIPLLVGYLYRNIIWKFFLFFVKLFRKPSNEDYIIDVIDESGKKFIRLSNHNLKNFNVPRGVTSIGNDAFRNCSSLSSVKIPSSVTSIGDGAFHDCKSLYSLVIPSSVTSIGNGAFMGCSSLSSLVIPSGVTSIGNVAFLGCLSLSSIVIPSSVTGIGNGAFLACPSLKRIEVDENNPIFCSIDGGVLFTKDPITKTPTTLVVCLPGRQVYSIPSSVTSIRDFAFSHCFSLSKIEIPEGVTSIGLAAFDGCSSLLSATIPSSVISIGDKAFDGCPKLTLRVPKGSYAEEYAKENGIKCETFE